MVARLVSIVSLWALGFAAFAAALIAIAARVDPSTVAPGEGPLVAARAFGLIGLLGGTLFAVAISIANRGLPLGRVPVWNAALWGAISAAAFPLLSGRADQTIILCPLGVCCALALRWTAARVSRRALPATSLR